MEISKLFVEEEFNRYLATVESEDKEDTFFKEVLFLTYIAGLQTFTTSLIMLIMDEEDASSAVASVHNQCVLLMAERKAKATGKRVSVNLLMLDQMEPH